MNLTRAPWQPLGHWLACALAVYLHNFRHVLVVPQGRDARGEEFDSGGRYWPAAVRMQVLSLLMAQLVLAALLALNAAWWGSSLLLFLIPITWVRAQSFAEHFEPLSEGFSLQQGTEVDAEQWQRAVAEKREGKLTPHGASVARLRNMPVALEVLLREGRDEYEARARGTGEQQAPTKPSLPTSPAQKGKV